MIRLLILTVFFCNMYARNPFELPVKKTKGTSIVKLTGTMKFGNKYAGIVDDGKLATVVFRNMIVNGYRVEDIGDRFIVVSHNGVTEKLFIN